MRKLVLGIATLLFGVAVAVSDADAAKRLGGGGSLGAQRSVTKSAPAGTPPSQVQQMAPSKQAAGTAQAAPGAQPAPAAAQPSGLSRWMPMLGGLALGGMLGYLLGANGMGGLMVGLLLVALLVFAGFFVVRMLMQKRADAPQPMQYAGLGSETVAAPPPSQASGFDTQTSPLARVASANVPAGFDVAGFLRGAKLNYMKLQVANDSGNLDELRELTEPDLFEHLQKDVLGRGNVKQQTDVLALNADLLEVVTEGDRHWASVRFSGTIRESADGATEGFEEVWNLSKPVSGSSGWLLAGIQQMH